MRPGVRQCQVRPHERRQIRVFKQRRHFFRGWSQLVAGVGEQLAGFRQPEHDRIDHAVEYDLVVGLPDRARLGQRRLVGLDRVLEPGERLVADGVGRRRLERAEGVNSLLDRLGLRDAG